MSVFRGIIKAISPSPWKRFGRIKEEKTGRRVYFCLGEVTFSKKELSRGIYVEYQERICKKHVWAINIRKSLFALPFPNVADEEEPAENTQWAETLIKVLIRESGMRKADIRRKLLNEGHSFKPNWPWEIPGLMSRAQETHLWLLKGRLADEGITDFSWLEEVLAKPMETTKAEATVLIERVHYALGIKTPHTKFVPPKKRE